jgi:hypothetical protein
MPDMELWAWLVAYLLGFALLQVYLYRYFIGQSTGDSSTEQTTPAYSEGGTSPVDRPESEDGDLVACGDCGTYNERDAAFTYCKECGSRLGR